jgi:hypothetical protein
MLAARADRHSTRPPIWVGARLALPGETAWLNARGEARCCLKADNHDFPAQRLLKAAYHFVWGGQRAWNGVAILPRSLPILTADRLPADRNDIQAR